MCERKVVRNERKEGYKEKDGRMDKERKKKERPDGEKNKRRKGCEEGKMQ